MDAPTTCPSCRALLPVGGKVSFCPTCGFSLTDIAPRDGWIRNNIDLRMVAKRQRALLWLILAQLVVYFSMMGSTTSRHATVLIIPLLALYVAIGILVLVWIAQLLSAMRVHIVARIFFLLLCFAPCINLLLIIGLNHRAIAVLREAGLTVGFMGVKDEEVTRLLARFTCRKCGYNLTGNTSGVCPECGFLTPLQS